MKILMINDNDPRQLIGGAESYLLDVRDALQALGHVVHVFALASGGSRKDDSITVFEAEENRPLLWYLRHTFFFLRLFRALRRCIETIGPDVIHVHNNYKYPVTVLLAIAGRTVVQTAHDYCAIYPTAACTRTPSCAGRSAKLALRHGCLHWKVLATEGLLLYNRIGLDRRVVDRFIAPSRDLQEHLHGAGVGGVTYLRNFAAAPPADTQPIRCTTALMVLFAGSLVAHKGVAVLLEAFEALQRTNLDVELWLVGDGPDHAELAARIETEEFSRIRLCGAQPKERLWAFYRAATVVVVPSLWLENAPLVALEAMACGKPIVASRVGGLPELVEDGRTGWLFERGNAKDLCAKLCAALASPALCTKFGAEAKRKALGNPLAEHADRLADIYQQLASA